LSKLAGNSIYAVIDNQGNLFVVREGMRDRQVQRSAAQGDCAVDRELVVARAGRCAVNFHIQGITAVEGHVAGDGHAAGAVAGREGDVFTAGSGIYIFGVGCSRNGEGMSAQGCGSIYGGLDGAVCRTCVGIQDIADELQSYRIMAHIGSVTAEVISADGISTGYRRVAASEELVGQIALVGVTRVV
jgi:hypothetical protein